MVTAVLPAAANTRYWNAGGTALNVETAGYALLTQLALGRVTYAGPIVVWITKQRNTRGGFISTQASYLHWIAPYCTPLYYTALYSTLFFSILSYSMLFITSLYTIPYHAILYSMLSCAVLCCAVLCYIVLCLAIYNNVCKTYNVMPAQPTMPVVRI